MAQRKSTALLDFIASKGSVAQALSNARIRIYSGTQPATADSAATGTLLATLTLAAAAYTGETKAQWNVAINITAGPILMDGVRIGDFPIMGDADVSATTNDEAVTLLAASINSMSHIHGFTASAATDTLTVTAPRGSGARHNGANLQVGLDTGTADFTYGNSGAPVVAGVAAVAGCNFQTPSASGVLTKEATVWSGTAIATGNAGWFRIEADPADNQSASTSFIRLDGSVGTSGAEMNISSIGVSLDAVFAITDGSFTVVR